MERRLYSRIPSHTKVRLYFNGHGHMDGQLSDFSQSGVSVSLSGKYQMPNVGDVIFMLADNMDEPYTMMMVRRNKKKLALVFTD